MRLLENFKTEILDPFILLLFGLALLYFLWGLAQFLLKKDSASGDRKELYNKMIWGVVGMTIMISVFGIMRFIINTVKAISGTG